MAEEKNVQPAEQVEKKSAAVKPVKEKVPFGVRVKNFFKNYKSELKKIVWSSKEQTAKNTSVVVALVVVSAVVLVLLDLGLHSGITALRALIQNTL